MFNPDPKPEKRLPKVQKPLKRTPLKRSKEYRIQKRSAKESQRLAKYMKQREEEFKKDPICRVQFCEALATEAHHPFGRIGNDLFIFKLICRPHHDQAEMNPNWAKENGISFSRLNKRS